jgi:hypothetical protein
MIVVESSMNKLFRNTGKFVKKYFWKKERLLILQNTEKQQTLLVKDLKKILIKRKYVKNNHNNNKSKNPKNKQCLEAKYQNGNFKVCSLEEV